MPAGAESVRLKAEVSVSDSRVPKDRSEVSLLFKQTDGIWADYKKYSLSDLNKGITIPVPPSPILTNEVRLDIESYGTSIDGIGYIGYNVNVKNLSIEFVGGTTSTGLIGEMEKNQSSISVMKDSIDLRVEKGKVISEINMTPGNVRIKGEKITLDGKTEVKDIIIKNANIESVSASKLTAGTINSNVVIATNIDAKYITGQNASFVRASFNSATGNKVQIDGNGIKTSGSGGYVELDENGMSFRKSTGEGLAGFKNSLREMSDGKYEENTICLYSEPGEYITLGHRYSGKNEVSRALTVTPGCEIRFDSSKVIFPATSGTTDQKVYFMAAKNKVFNGPVIANSWSVDNGAPVGLGFTGGDVYLFNKTGTVSLSLIIKHMQTLFSMMPETIKEENEEEWLLPPIEIEDTTPLKMNEQII